MWTTLNHVLLKGSSSDEFSSHVYQATADEQALYLPDATKLCIGPQNQALILPGSFNPLHDGHKGMLAVAEQMTGLPGAYEMTTNNADKPALDFLTMQERVAQFKISNSDSSPSTPSTLWLTNVATYAEKAALFPGATFVLGVDTMARVAQLKFYENSQDKFNQALTTFTNCDTRFLVFGRQSDTYITLSDLEIPEALLSHCIEVTEAQFRMDISSTALRQAQV